MTRHSHRDVTPPGETEPRIHGTTLSSFCKFLRVYNHFKRKKRKRIHTPLRLRNLPDLLSLCPRATRWFLHLHLSCLYIPASHSRYLQVAQGHGPVSHAPIVRRVWYMQHSWGKHTGIRHPQSILPRSSREDLVYFQCNLRGVLIKPLLVGY